MQKNELLFRKTENRIHVASRVNRTLHTSKIVTVSIEKHFGRTIYYFRPAIRQPLAEKAPLIKGELDIADARLGQ